MGRGTRRAPSCPAGWSAGRRRPHSQRGRERLASVPGGASQAPPGAPRQRPGASRRSIPRSRGRKKGNGGSGRRKSPGGGALASEVRGSGTVRASKTSAACKRASGRNSGRDAGQQAERHRGHEQKEECVAHALLLAQNLVRTALRRGELGQENCSGRVGTPFTGALARRGHFFDSIDRITMIQCA